MENNLFNVIENIINSDSKDMLLNYKDALIYGIIFGFDEEQCEELLYRFSMSGLTTDYIEKINHLHNRWEFLKQNEYNMSIQNNMIKGPVKDKSKVKSKIRMENRNGNN